MKAREQYEEMDMPTPCESCGRWCELNDMVGSSKWYKDIVICSECADIEEDEINLDDELQEQENMLADAQWQVKESGAEIARLKVKQVELQEKLDKWRSNEQE